MASPVAAPTDSPKPVPEISVRRNFGWTAAGNAVQAACQWAIVAVLAKMTSAEVVGQYALGVAVATPIFMLAQLNLRSVLATDVKGTHPFRDYRDLRFISIAISMAVTLGVAWWGYSGAERPTIAAVGLILMVEWCSDIFLGLLQQHERMNRIALSLIMRGPSSVLVLAGTMKMTHDLVTSLLAMLVCRVCIYLVYDSRLAVRDIFERSTQMNGSACPPPTPWASRWNSQARLFQTALPLGIVMMAGSLSNNVPRYFITHDLNTYSLGIFAALASVPSVGTMVVNALGQASTPRLAKLFAAAEVAAFRRLTVRLVWLGAAIGIAGVMLSMTLGYRVLSILFRPEYAQHTRVLTVLCGGAAAAFVASALGYAITAARRFREQIPIQLVSVAASVTTAYLLVPRMGLTGAALAVAAAPVAQALGELLVLRNALRDARFSARDRIL